MNITEIEKGAREYADARALLSSLVTQLQEELEAARRVRLPGIKKAVAVAADAKSRLRASIEAAPDLFVKPRTITVAGVKVGYQKSKGKILVDEEGQVIKRIHRWLPDLAEDLIQTKEKLIKKALEKLSAAQLKKLGVTVEQDGDLIVIRPVDGDMEKLVTPC